MGHAMFITLQDIMIRYSRMKGINTLWLPGTDHAGIATQVKHQGFSIVMMEFTLYYIEQGLLIRAFKFKRKVDYPVLVCPSRLAYFE